jgi:glycosyltransferase involved in cell wall biosynthesis
MSIVDQRGIEIEHIVKDAGSTDGTVEWLQTRSDLSYRIRKDSGMYHAINQALKLAHGEIIGYLNCDEQYLSGTLSFIAEYFAKHRNVDILFGDALLVNPEGDLLAYRKGYQPRWYYIAASHLYVLSCTMFFRRELIDEGMKFDESYKSIGDQDFVIRALQRGYKAAHVSRYLSVFTMTGSNLSASEISVLESRRLLASLPIWIKWVRLPLNILRLIEKTLSGAYYQEMPLTYAIYADDLSKRKEFVAHVSTFRWPDS